MNEKIKEQNPTAVGMTIKDHEYFKPRMIETTGYTKFDYCDDGHYFVCQEKPRDLGIANGSITKEKLANTCPFCHQTVSKGIDNDFKVTHEDPVICIDCAREVLGTMTLLEGGFW